MYVPSIEDANNLTMMSLEVPDPGPGEAVVDIKTCGVCHTDLHYQQGGIGDEYPYLLGHEATGVVSAIGEGVDHVTGGAREITIRTALSNGFGFGGHNAVVAMSAHEES